MSTLKILETGAEIKGHITEAFAAALADAAGESDSGAVVARLVDGVFVYVAPSDRTADCVVVYDDR